jgi:hypothetical protein
MDLDLWLRLLNNGAIYPLSSCSQGAIRRWEKTKTETYPVNFMKEMRNTLIKNGAKSYRKPVLKTYCQIFRFKMKRLFIFMKIYPNKPVIYQ